VGDLFDPVVGGEVGLGDDGLDGGSVEEGDDEVVDGARAYAFVGGDEEEDVVGGPCGGEHVADVVALAWDVDEVDVGCFG